ncbi:hypothetical protein BDV95DRAFT_165314 [Massariosphaeria phaeospora]|uniref:Uncharacterized protein n=1 Tax=Massariosphaeria phaeospora TaxID=100035 RepID=A0A7C8MA47_9PLEO|nr:hypothetical protein BDV95DRAFT_165314 [Massariosphaeria phaeospora]
MTRGSTSRATPPQRPFLQKPLPVQQGVNTRPLNGPLRERTINSPLPDPQPDTCIESLPIQHGVNTRPLDGPPPAYSGRLSSSYQYPGDSTVQSVSGASDQTNTDRLD